MTPRYQFFSTENHVDFVNSAVDLFFVRSVSFKFKIAYEVLRVIFRDKNNNLKRRLKLAIQYNL